MSPQLSKFFDSFVLLFSDVVLCYQATLVSYHVTWCIVIIGGYLVKPAAIDIVRMTSGDEYAKKKDFSHQN